MNRMMKAVLTIAFLAGAVMVTGTAASADSIGDQAEAEYRDAMWYFVPELGRWASELEHTVTAADLKPEMATALPELAYRGEYMVYDLEGTPPPAHLADAHARLMDSVARLTALARTASDDPAGTLAEIEAERERFDSARREIRGWLMSGIEITGAGAAPAVLVAGN